MAFKQRRAAQVIPVLRLVTSPNQRAVLHRGRSLWARKFFTLSHYIAGWRPSQSVSESKLYFSSSAWAVPLIAWSLWTQLLGCGHDGPPLELQLRSMPLRSHNGHERERACVCVLSCFVPLVLRTEPRKCRTTSARPL